MTRKIFVDDDLIDNLILKSLPPEYEVLLNDESLDSDEEEYFYLILLILSGQINEAKKWLHSDEFKRISKDIENVPLNFFDDLELKLRVYVQDKFELLLAPLISIFYEYANEQAYKSLNKIPTMTDNDLLRFLRLKQYNYHILSNLCVDLNKNFKDIIFEDIMNGKDVKDMEEDIENSGVDPINKHTAQQRAKMIAQTEVNNIKQNSKIQAYIDNDIHWVDIITKGDGKVCSICLDAESNNPYPIEEADGMIPFHPRCRCEYGASKENFDNNPYLTERFNEMIDEEIGEYFY